MPGFALVVPAGIRNLGATERRASTSKDWNFFFFRGNTVIRVCVLD